DAEHVQKMARIVGAAASEQAADFLELCGKGIEEHFMGLGLATITKKAKRAILVRDWNVGVQVHVSSVPRGSLSCGVLISAPPSVRIALENGACGVAVPWLWSSGGRRGEDAVWKILGGW